MSKINFAPMVSIDEAKTIIGAIGDEVTCILISEPGVGKSSILSGLAEMNGDQWRKVGDDFPSDKYDYIYIDCTCQGHDGRCGINPQSPKQVS
jgi:midasin (ATPase involved in ribosome maturation)